MRHVAYEASGLEVAERGISGLRGIRRDGGTSESAEFAAGAAGLGGGFAAEDLEFDEESVEVDQFEFAALAGGTVKLENADFAADLGSSGRVAMWPGERNFSVPVLDGPGPGH